MAKTRGEAPTKNDAAPVKAEEETWAKVEEEAARARSEEEARAKAEQEAREALAKAKQKAQVRARKMERAKAVEEARKALAKAEEEARIKAEQEARVTAEQESQAKAEEEKAEEEAQIKAEQEEQALGKEQFESATAAATFLAPSFEPIAATTIDYSKTSLENGFIFVEKLVGARSFRSAIYIRSEYARTSYADFVAYLRRIGELNTKLATKAFERRSHVG
jgi:Phasin protein